VFQLFFANNHKIPQNFKILTFDLKTAQKVLNRKNSIERSIEFVIKIGVGTEAVDLFESIHLFVYKYINHVTKCYQWS
jgi:hypothetical protein